MFYMIFITNLLMKEMKTQKDMVAPNLYFIEVRLKKYKSTKGTMATNRQQTCATNMKKKMYGKSQIPYQTWHKKMLFMKSLYEKSQKSITTGLTTGLTTGYIKPDPQK